MNAPRWFWRWIRIGPRLVYALGLGGLIGRFVLLLTTTGRRSGEPRVTPLAYQELDGSYFVASARGSSADWFRNIQATPEVKIRVGRRSMYGTAQVVTNPQAIAGFMQRQLERNPRMFGAIFRLEGLPSSPSFEQLERLAASRPMVVIRPREVAHPDLL